MQIKDELIRTPRSKFKACGGIAPVITGILHLATAQFSIVMEYDVVSISNKVDQLSSSYKGNKEQSG